MPLLTWGELGAVALTAYAEAPLAEGTASASAITRTVDDHRAGVSSLSVAQIASRIDFGSGLSPQQFTRLFERFEQGPTDPPDDGEGEDSSAPA